MNAMSFGTAKRKETDEPKAEQPADAAWMVLDAANDLGDTAAVEVCRRVIDANLNGRPASPSDLQFIFEYFR